MDGGERDSDDLLRCPHYALYGWEDMQTGEGLSEVGRADLMCLVTSCSKHLNMIGVSATGQ